MNGKKSCRWMMLQGLIFLLLAYASAARAQFFWRFPQQRQVEQPHEKYTAPTYKGSEKALRAFIMKNFHQSAEHGRLEGNIVVAVIVSPKGKPVEAHLVRSGNDYLNAEAVRVCKKMKFKPATLGKKKVKGRIDIIFPVKHGRVTFLDLPTIEV